MLQFNVLKIPIRDFWRENARQLFRVKDHYKYHDPWIEIVYGLVQSTLVYSSLLSMCLSGFSFGCYSCKPYRIMWYQQQHSSHNGTPQRLKQNPNLPWSIMVSMRQEEDWRLLLIAYATLHSIFQNTIPLWAVVKSNLDGNVLIYQKYKTTAPVAVS